MQSIMKNFYLILIILTFIFNYSCATQTPNSKPNKDYPRTYPSENQYP